MTTANLPAIRAHHAAWNKGRLVGQKRPLLPKHVWAIRVRLELAERHRDLALFNTAIDSKLRGCDLIRLRVTDIDRTMVRGKLRTIEVRACPVRFSPDPKQIEAAHRAYDDWWHALDWVRAGLLAGGMLREVGVTAAMPKVRPWQNR